MKAFQNILFDVWREACRHIHITESASAIAALLRCQMPLDRLLVRRLDIGRSCLETVAVAWIDPGQPMDEARTEVPPGDLQKLLAWCRGNEIFRRSAGQDQGGLSLIVPHGVDGPILAAGLCNQQTPVGVLILAVGQGQALLPEHEEVLNALREPLAVALENDQQVREMGALREAAEADRQSLLTKLGRQALGDTIVGADSGLQAVMERVGLVSRSDVPVLIFGETGTGKELIARAIHERSDRASGPFMRVNCGAIPPELIDSQLFGHERGSFTGASETHRGWFERADRGTLFLDEIGELPSAAQVRLLRVLQDGTFERVGGQQPTTVDVRIVAATHRDLSGMVREEKFRQDLWYRLAVFPINLPPLRNRPEDIPSLARHFAHRAATRFGLPPLTPTADDIRLLVSYPWPGNVRELGTVLDRAAILGNGHGLEVAKALGVQTVSAGPSPNGAAAHPAPPERLLSLDAAMKRHIESALQVTHGRVEGPHGAAALLEINPHTLRARMRKLGIEWGQFREV
jgi:transcriptional regulator with GAF, ATPase, and Fis domain